MLFYSPSWNPSLKHYNALRGCIFSVCPDFDLIWAIQAHNEPGAGVSLDQPHLPPLPLPMGWSSLQGTELHLSSPRPLLCLWLTAQVSISLQGSSHSPSKPRFCSGFMKILFCVTTIISCRTWTCLCREGCKWKGSKSYSSSHLCVVLLLYVALSHSTEVAVAALCICKG